MTLIAKVLLGTLSGITVAGIGTGIAVPVVLASREEVKSVAEEKQPQGPDPKECFVISTETTENVGKFVICTDKSFYLYNSEGETHFEKITKIEGPNSKQLTVTLEKEQSVKKLTLKDEEWNKYPRDMSFLDICKFEYIEGYKPALICSKPKTFDTVTSSLTPLQ
ncbi:hypothetical protein WEN_02305 [Mycoplasma wenyonii str. Massachusetts]|uniref:Uncharacterized protein n=1 Tax=Mycoplasma wenyonii (strain Massachusetts) TaxID=1197325 RepID=I6Z6Q4_MYCWM|nr:hypothetical protein [Mycoplasma wenyonii]AFN65248.1 hypothetical protein WEN_02305 [Mycoplasma wenyonii str. Massachusetts]